MRIQATHSEHAKAILTSMKTEVNEQLTDYQHKYVGTRTAYHLMMPMLLGFPYIFQEAGAYLFGVPHRHEHFASTLGDKSEHRLMEAGQSPTLPASHPTVMHTLMECASTSGSLLSAIPGRRH